MEDGVEAASRALAFWQSIGDAGEASAPCRTCQVFVKVSRLAHALSTQGFARPARAEAGQASRRRVAAARRGEMSDGRVGSTRGRRPARVALTAARRRATGRYTGRQGARGHGALHRGRSRAGRPAGAVRAPERSVVARALGRRFPRRSPRWTRALAGGAWVAGYAAYELGYAFEPRLAALMPAGRRLPLLEFGVFEAPGPARAGGAGRRARAVRAGAGTSPTYARGVRAGRRPTSAPATSTRRT